MSRQKNRLQNQRPGIFSPSEVRNLEGTANPVDLKSRDDLEKSGVDVTLSAVTVDSGGVLREGIKFNRSMMKDVKQLGIDEFGESGEFHSLAKVWSVSLSRALGIDK